MMRLAPLVCLLSLASLLPAQSVTPPPPSDARDNILYSEETERPGPLLKKEFRNIVMDQKAIWTSPFHMTKNEAGWWVLFGAGAGALVAADYHLSTQLPNSADQTAFSRKVSQVGASYTVLPVAAGFYAFGAWKDDPKARETGALGLESLADALITVEILKAVFSRERPLEGSGHGHFFRWGHDSFPSGHSIESFALASVVAHEYDSSPWVPAAAYGLAGLVSASRFSARKHFASDIIVGGGMGYFIGRYVFQTHADHRIHKRYRTPVTAQFIPFAEPSTRSYGLRLQLARAER